MEAVEWTRAFNETQLGDQVYSFSFSVSGGLHRQRASSKLTIRKKIVTSLSGERKSRDSNQKELPRLLSQLLLCSSKRTFRITYSGASGSNQTGVRVPDRTDQKSVDFFESHLSRLSPKHSFVRPTFTLKRIVATSQAGEYMMMIPLFFVRLLTFREGSVSL